MEEGDRTLRTDREWKEETRQRVQTRWREGKGRERERELRRGGGEEGNTGRPCGVQYNQPRIA